MLKLRFFNVGDGDAILIEVGESEDIYRILVDTGRPYVTKAIGSRRQSAASHISRLGIKRLDEIIVTHLHADHQGGLRELSKIAEIGKLTSGYIPSQPGALIPREEDAVKTVAGMIECVNNWSRDVSILRDAGTQLVQVSKTVKGLHSAPGFSMDIIVPSETMTGLQQSMWDGMISGAKQSDDEKYAVSKSRNPASLRVRLRYAGRNVELAGDCYGSVWENDDIEPCDIFKVPHHSDAKSLTPKLVKKLLPRYAVISCAKEYNPAKDRPSAAAIALLRDAGAKVLFTDSFKESARYCLKRRSLDFTILDDGSIIPPYRRV